MDALTSARFISGIVVGVILFYLWQMRMAKKNNG